MRRPILTVVVTCGLLSVGCIETRATHYGSPVPVPVQEYVAPCNEPKARIAVSRFEDKTGKDKLTKDIGDSMADMLAVSLFRTGCFIVSRRTVIEEVLPKQDLAEVSCAKLETEAEISEIESIDFQITGAVTEFKHGAVGTGDANAFGHTCMCDVEAIVVVTDPAYVALSIHIVDARTSKVLMLINVEGKATDPNCDELPAEASAGDGSIVWCNIPVEKAIRVAIQEAVRFIVQQTPQRYFHYRPGLAPVQQGKMHGEERVEKSQAALVERE